MTGGSVSCFGEQYRNLLLYLHQTLDEKTAINKYILLSNIIYNTTCSHVASNSVLFAESGDTISAVRQQREELHGEMHGSRNRRLNVDASLEV